MPIKKRSARRFLKHLDSLWRIELQFHQSDSAFSVNWNVNEMHFFIPLVKVKDGLHKDGAVSYYTPRTRDQIRIVCPFLFRLLDGLSAYLFVRIRHYVCFQKQTYVVSEWTIVPLCRDSRFPFIKKKWNFSKCEWYIYGIEWVTPMLVLVSSRLLPS